MNVLTSVKVASTGYKEYIWDMIVTSLHSKSHITSIYRWLHELEEEKSKGKINY